MNRNGVTLKDPTMAQRKAISAIAKAEGIYMRGDGRLLQASLPWIWFAHSDGRLSGCQAIKLGTEKFVLFDEFIKHMYEPKEEEVQHATSKLSNGKGVLLEHPTLTQRRAISTIAAGKGIDMHLTKSVLDENIPLIYFTWNDGVLRMTNFLELDREKHIGVSFEGFIECMYVAEQVQPAEEKVTCNLKGTLAALAALRRSLTKGEVIENGVWLCIKKINAPNGEVSFKKGEVYEELLGIHWKLVLMDEQRLRRVIDVGYLKHFTRVG